MTSSSSAGPYRPAHPGARTGALGPGHAPSDTYATGVRPAYPQGGRPPKHGKEFRFAKPDTWGEPDAETVQVTDRYGTAQAMAWDRIHPRLTTRSAWIDHDGELPIIEGTLIRLTVDHLPGGGAPLPVRLWSSKTGMITGEVNLWWQAFLRRLDLEHTFVS